MNKKPVFTVKTFDVAATRGVCEAMLAALFANGVAVGAGFIVRPIDSSDKRFNGSIGVFATRKELITKLEELGLTHGVTVWLSNDTPHVFAMCEDEAALYYKAYQRCLSESHTLFEAVVSCQFCGIGKAE